MCNEQLEYELRRGLINAGITPVVPEIEGIHARTVAREKMYVLTSLNHPFNAFENIDIRAISNEPLASPLQRICSACATISKLGGDNGSMVMMDDSEVHPFPSVI